MPAAASSAPDPQRVGGIAWLEHTRGRLTPQERRRLVPAILRTHADLVQTQVALMLRRRPSTLSEDLPEPPDSALARAAEAACVESLPTSVAAHSFRTWWYGLLLAQRDGLRPDPELAYVAALLHDVGLAAAVPGEDFTLRSAERARQVLHEHGVSAADVLAVRDAISVHTLPGVTPERDGVLGTYLQAGAMLDLAGLRACDVPTEAVRTITERHPRGELVADLSRAVRSEARALPDGRFALISRGGFLLALRLSRF